MTITAPTSLGNTGLTVSPVTLGASWLAADGVEGGVELASAMISSPFALTDTSNNYTEGRSEAALGRALEKHGLTAGHWIATKVDAEPGTGRFDRDRVWRSFEESIARLGVQKVPLLHLHDPHAITPEQALSPGGAVQGLIELREQGLVQAIGVATDSVEQLARYVESGSFDALLTHNRYTLVERRALPVIEAAAQRGMGVFNAAPFGGGLLAGRGTSYGYTESPPALLEWVERARAVCQEHGVDLPTVALHFSLRNPSIHSTVVGISRVERIPGLLAMFGTEVPEQVWAELEALGTPPSPLTH